MNNTLENKPTIINRLSLLKNIGKIILRIIGAGLALIVGLWLIMASNMGPAYLPHIMNGDLDFWIRMTLLAVGLGIWISIAVWLLWLILCCFYDFIRRH
ncbi:hypothetical protein [Psychrobacter sp. 201]|uniref:hypothetical protein n=1 Tax=uncultured Psychrobacter sp. TaxID=259303 RepID=UPI0010556C55